MGVCLSGGGLGRPPPEPEKRAVRILLECILVLVKSSLCEVGFTLRPKNFQNLRLETDFKPKKKPPIIGTKFPDTGEVARNQQNGEIYFSPDFPLTRDNLDICASAKNSTIPSIDIFRHKIASAPC